MGRRELSATTFELEVDREGLEYTCGDCTLLVRNGVDSRPYSFSSHPDESVLRFLVRRLEGPDTPRSFSRWLGTLQVGEEVGVGTPFGAFRPGRGSQEVWFAGGTGLSPFLSALRASSPPTPLVLAVGVRSPDEVTWASWLEERATVEWAFSRQPAPGSGTRRLTDVAREVPVAPDIRYYLCGGRSLVDALATVLFARGVVAGQIHEELFFS